jgi:hypothetical protein
MQEESVTLVDDIDGSPAWETVRFGLDGQGYEIDLSALHAGELRGALAGYVARARRARPARRGGRMPASRRDLPGVREFARARGYDVKDRGAVPARIAREYEAVKSLKDG